MFPVFAEEVADDGTVTPVDLTGWTPHVDVEFYDGQVDAGEVHSLFTRIDGDRSEVALDPVDLPGGRLRCTLKDGLAPVNPELGRAVIVFVYIRLEDNIEPLPNKITRDFIVSYKHNADFV